MSAVRMVAHGRVQGVGFRFFTRQTANSLGVTGWVRNNPDGTVEIFAEADDETLDNFADAIKKGPSFGNVTDLTVNREESTGNYSTFSIAF